MEAAASQRPLAFLVDGDNASPGLIREMLAESSKYGEVIIRRVYGDWTSRNLASWKAVLQEHALTPTQQFANVAGKNATDSAMIIDAMDILHGSRVGGFCLVSSDSDYTRLATRIREAGLFVMGIGETKTPTAFRQACHVFVSTDNLRLARTPEVGRPKVGKPVVEEARRVPEDAVTLLQQAFENVVRDDGSAHPGEMGEALRRLDPAFDSRTYGFSKLVDLIQALPKVFEVVRRQELGPGAVYVRRKRSS